MLRDKLFLLNKDFEDPAYPGEVFYCWDCVSVEGLLKLYPSLETSLDIVRVDWKRPRPAIIELIGEENQNSPVLVFADDAPSDLADGEYKGRRFANTIPSIRKALAARHAIARAHP
ncbi:MAG: DUF3088 domain-containing protein [Parvularculaceae bacterium]|nr:DUF3088 domain-containing protein [Parvularculaceae bacterium]